VSEEITADDDALSAQVLNGTIEVDGVPVDGRGRDEAQAGRTEALVLEGAVSDLALTMKEDRATQRVAGLALVESGMAALPQVGIRQPLQGEEGAFDPSKRPQCARRTAAAGRSTLVVRRWASIAWTTAHRDRWLTRRSCPPAGRPASRPAQSGVGGVGFRLLPWQERQPIGGRAPGPAALRSDASVVALHAALYRKSGLIGGDGSSVVTSAVVAGEEVRFS
jgi:hypothetical protein